MNEEPQGETTRLQYIGPETQTRGQYGECVRFGHLDSTGAIWVWDSTIGWIYWSNHQGADDPEWTEVHA